MSLKRIQSLAKSLNKLPLHNLCVIPRGFHVSPASNLIQKWRKERGLPLNPNSCGVLTDGPDYTFVDGRPTPYGVRQSKRILNQKELAEKIISLTGEVDFALKRYESVKKKEADERQRIVNSRLLPKGPALLKKK